MEPFWTRTCLTSMPKMQSCCLQQGIPIPPPMPVGLCLSSWGLKMFLPATSFSRKYNALDWNMLRMSFPTITSNTTPMSILPQWVDVLGKKLDKIMAELDWISDVNHDWMFMRIYWSWFWILVIVFQDRLRGVGTAASGAFTPQIIFLLPTWWFLIQSPPPLHPIQRKWGLSSKWKIPSKRCKLSMTYWRTFCQRRQSNLNRLPSAWMAFGIVIIICFKLYMS